MSVFKKGISFGLLFWFLFFNTPVVSSYILTELAYFGLTDEMNVTRTRGVRTTHTTVYNDDAAAVEKAYLSVRYMVGADSVNDRVRVIRKSNLLPDGSIGRWQVPTIRGVTNHEIIGIYCNGVIIYDGDPVVLKHELAHFFYEKMKDGDRSESFAQVVEGVYILLGRLVPNKE